MKTRIAYLVAVGVCVWFVSVHAGCQLPRKQVTLQLLESQMHSGVSDRQGQFLVISERTRFVEVYTRIHTTSLQKPSLPAVDFATHRVLVALMGQRSTAGYAIQFDDRIVQRDGTLEVTVRFHTPPKGAMVAQVITSPYALAVVGRGPYTRVHFMNEAGETLQVLDVS
jgi:hypothetical protein